MKDFEDDFRKRFKVNLQPHQAFTYADIQYFYNAGMEAENEACAVTDKIVIKALETAQNRIAASRDMCDEDEVLLWDRYGDAIKAIRDRMK